MCHDCKKLYGNGKYKLSPKLSFQAWTCIVFGVDLYHCDNYKNKKSQLTELLTQCFVDLHPFPSSQSFPQGPRTVQLTAAISRTFGWQVLYCVSHWNFGSFDAFADVIKSYYVVNREPGNWKCSCPCGLKQYVCKHVLFFRTKFDFALPDSLATKRKHGRPLNVAQGLNRWKLLAFYSITTICSLMMHVCMYGVDNTPFVP